jgi:hypothetical protein
MQRALGWLWPSSSAVASSPRLRLPLAAHGISCTAASGTAWYRDRVEAALLEQVSTFDGAGLRVIGQRILQLLDQDGKAPDDRGLAEPRREFHYASRKDGSVVFRGKGTLSRGPSWRR